MPTRNDFTPGEFCWLDFMAHDFDAAVAFYGSVFGWTHQVMPTPDGAPPYAFFMKGEVGVAGLGQMNDEMKAQGIPPVWNSYINTADCAATEAKARELGATVTCPTTEIPGHGKLAFFLDPEGGSIAVWQSLNPEGPGMLVGEPGSSCWFEFMTRDPSAAKDFYGKLVGWDFAAMPMGDIEYTMAKKDGKDVAGLMKMDGPQFAGVPAYWMPYFAVEDCDATVSTATANGGKVHVPPMDIQVGRMSVLADSQGGTFSIIALTPPA